jgi:hypothetical protein
LRGAQAQAEKLHAGFHQLVGLVEHRCVHRGQELGHAGVAQRQVGKKEMVVDDHQVGRHRFAPRCHHVAAGVLRAFVAQAVVACGGHQRYHR